MSLTKNDIAYQIDMLLGFKRLKKSGPTYNAVKAVFTSMTNALRRGESVYIRGFGTFKVKSYESFKRPAQFFYKGSSTRTVIDIPACKKVLFTPSKLLRSYIEQDQTNAD